MREEPRTRISYFGCTNHRLASRPFGIRQADRLSHIYIIGKTGVGKSTLIETLALQDLRAGRGFALLDPAGDMVENLYHRATEAERNRIRYLDAADPAQPYGYNPLRRVRDDRIPLAVAGLIETLRKLWPDAWGVRMEHVLRNTLFALLERSGSTLPDILRLYADEKWRKSVVKDIRNDAVRTFWKSEFQRYHFRQQADAVAPIQNKIGALLTDPTLARILVSPKTDLHFRTIMDEGGVLLVNLAKGRLGEGSSSVLGGLILSTLGLAAYSRADNLPGDRTPFALFVDEFQSFTTLMLANMTAELRKNTVSLVLANQHLHQLEPDIRHAVLGNAGTIISFRVGPEDAVVLAKEYHPEFTPDDLLSLPNRSIYLKMMIDGTPSRPFSADTLAFEDIGDAIENSEIQQRPSWRPREARGDFY